MEHYQKMSLFNYTLPSGAEFTVRGPAGATQAQADRIFYEQVAAGALVGYQAGQTLTSVATQITKFELSRLDRGTAGVDTSPVLAINQGLQIQLDNTQTLLQAVQALPRPVSLPNLANTPLTSPIDEADIVLIKGDNFAPSSIGANGTTALTEFQTQKILAQIANLVDQPADQITQDKGLGQYGFTAYALEQAGYVKPGTSLRFFAVEPEDFVTVMSSPSVRTGRDGVYSSSDLLSDPGQQTQVQQQIMQQSYDSLLASGTITTPPRPSVNLGTGRVFTSSGLQSVSALTALSLLSINSQTISGTIGSAVSSLNSLNRLASTANINLATIGSGAVNSLTAGLGNLGNLANTNFASLTNQITGGVGALVTTASKFGSEATALWAKAGEINFDSIGTGIGNFASSGLNSLTAGIGSSIGNFASSGLNSLTAGLGNNLNNITGQFSSLAGGLNSITSNLTNLVPGSLSNLTGSLDIFGKAGSFATNFANPFGALDSLPNLGSLTAGLSSQLSSVTGALSGQIGALSGQLTGALTGQLGALSGQLTGALTGQLGALSGQLTGALTGQLGALSGQLTGALTGVLGNFGAVAGLFGSGGDLVSGTAVAGGFNNTVNRATVDAAFARIVGSDKIPLPTFQYPSLAALAPRLDIQQAQNFLQNQLRGATASVGQAVSGQVTGAARSLFG
jgi:hypothetical protein